MFLAIDLQAVNKSNLITNYLMIRQMIYKLLICHIIMIFRSGLLPTKMIQWTIYINISLYLFATNSSCDSVFPTWVQHCYRVPHRNKIFIFIVFILCILPCCGLSLYACKAFGASLLDLSSPYNFWWIIIRARLIYDAVLLLLFEFFSRLIWTALQQLPLVFFISWLLSSHRHWQ